MPENNPLLCAKWHATHFESQGLRQLLEQGEDGSYMWFKADGTLVCNENNEVATGQWTYNEATQMINITTDKIVETYQLIHLTTDELVLRQYSKDFGEAGLVFRKMPTG